MSKIKRTKIGQKAHDTEVRKTANNLKEQGYNVAADIRGMKRPPIISGKIPDVIAEKGNKIKIVEIETEDSLIADIDQRRKFRNWSNKSKNRTFSTKVVRKKK